MFGFILIDTKCGEGGGDELFDAAMAGDQAVDPPALAHQPVDHVKKTKLADAIADGRQCLAQAFVIVGLKQYSVSRSSQQV